MHENSGLMFAEYAKDYFKPELRVLEIGPAGFPSAFQKIVNEDRITWHTLDIWDNPKLTYPNCKENEFPVSDNKYDIVLSGQVIEHVRRPWIWLKEVSRVTKKGGVVITINPVSWHYHEAPIDCWRIYPEGMKALYEDVGLNVILSTWGSFETEGFPNLIPGISMKFQSRTMRIISKLFGWVGFPVQRSYDTITVGEKL